MELISAPERRKVIVDDAPVSKRYFTPGMEATIEGERIRLSGC